jgi:CubicO group peptidase (beta-lactamase class C family)
MVRQVCLYPYLFAHLCAFAALPVHSQMAQSAQQRMQTVQSHLARYVIIRGSKHDDLDLYSQMKVLGVPAVSIAAIRNGVIDWARAYGVCSADGGSVSTETLFGAASISKSVTALESSSLWNRAKSIWMRTLIST